MRRSKTITAVVLTVLMVMNLIACDLIPDNGKRKLTADGRIVVTGCDWGPAVSKAIISVPETLDQTQTLAPEMFNVRETGKTGLFNQSSSRTVTACYFSDENGYATDNTGNYIALELYCSPEEGSPFYYDNSSGFNKWLAKYSLEITTKKDQSLLLASKEEVRISSVISFEKEPDPATVLLPEASKTDTSGVFTGSEGNTLTYASYVPDNASEDNRRPLVIWLHGAGEGGTDPRITIYGNKVVSLMGEEFQSTMDGAYVLVPQTSTYWKRNEDGDYFDNDKPGDHSMYLNDLKELIDTYVDSNYIDPDRILIGGCSNGGFMALDLVIHYPEQFAAAYLICEIYEPEQISDEELDAIKDVPMWFVYAENDQTVVPSAYEEPLIARLAETGAADVHVTVFQDVHDMSGRYQKDGNPYQYLGHFSWIYFFNNECYEDDLSLWQWLSEQGVADTDYEE